MADTLPPELTGKGKRVAGVFIFMIGASIILDTHAFWMGVPTIVAAVVLFASGMAEARVVEPLRAPQPDATTEPQP